MSTGGETVTVWMSPRSAMLGVGRRVSSVPTVAMGLPPSSWRSGRLHRDLLGLVFGDLGEDHLEDAVLQVGAHLVRVDTAREREASREGHRAALLPVDG